MPALQQLQIITFKRLEAFPEDTSAKDFDEQIPYMTGSSQEHQTISTELTTILTIVQPDFIIVSEKDKEHTNKIYHPKSTRYPTHQYHCPEILL